MAHLVSPLAPVAVPHLPAIDGVELAIAETGIRYKNRPDVLLAVLAPGTSVAGCFTLSKSRSAPVDWCAQSLKGGKARAVVINAGNANAFTGKSGVATVTAVAKAAAQKLKCKPAEIFQASTGVIGEPLDPAPIVNALPTLVAGAKADCWADAARADAEMLLSRRHARSQSQVRWSASPNGIQVSRPISSRASLVEGT